MANNTVFVLTKEGYAPETWELPFNNIMAIKPGTGQKKFIGYYPGEDSVFKEDIEKVNKELKPMEIPVFEFNKATNRTQLTVENSNTNLITYLKLHPWFNKKYTITSDEIESQKVVDEYELKFKAATLVRSDDDLELRSKALVVFGLQAIHYDIATAKAKLQVEADKQPDFVINKLSGVDFESQYISAQAYVKGIVKNNHGQTAVIWGDTENVILLLAVGEIGNIKLGEFLNSNTDQSITTLQTIAQKLGVGVKSDAPKNTIDTSVKDAEIAALTEQSNYKDAEIERLKAALEAANNGSLHELTTTDTTDVNPDSEMTLEEATEKYIEKFGKEPGPTVKGDLEWILKKLK